MKRVSIGLLGCGTVGRGFVELVGREQARIGARFGVELAIGRILVRDVGKRTSRLTTRVILVVMCTQV